MTKNEMIQNVAWLGEFADFHQLGEYSIVEYKGHVYDGCSRKEPAEYETKSSYSPFINGKRINQSFHSLESAIVGAIAYKYDGGNTRADVYFLRAINHPETTVKTTSKK